MSGEVIRGHLDDPACPLHAPDSPHAEPPPPPRPLWVDRCLAHFEDEPCPVCRGYIAAGL